MPKICDNKSVGQIISDRKGNLVVIERRNYPKAFAMPAGHVDENKSFAEAIEYETYEETGIIIVKNICVLQEKIDNPCRREKGSHHFWKVYQATEWKGTLKAGSDAKEIQCMSLTKLRKIAMRTEYFMEKYHIPWQRVGNLVHAIFGADPAVQKTDPEWKKEMGLEPVWYYILKQVNVL